MKRLLTTVAIVLATVVILVVSGGLQIDATCGEKSWSAGGVKHSDIEWGLRVPVPWCN